MTKKDIKQKIKEIKSIKDGGDYDQLEKIVLPFIKKLFEEKQYIEIVFLFEKTLTQDDPGYYEFETAYAFNELHKYTDAEEIYEFLLNFDSKNTSILNNLSNIKKAKGDIDKAFELIKKAYEISNGKDEIVSRNYETLLKVFKEKEEIKLKYNTAIENLKKETKWAIIKLENFLNNTEKDSDFKSGEIPIPRWKFKVLIGTDEEKADSLREQWLRKGYLRETDQKTDRFVAIYEINPNLRNFLKKVKPVELNKDWFAGFENVNVERLEQIQYSLILERIEKVNQKYRNLIKRDFDELVFNYLLGNKKSTIILSGSFIELLFTYECNKKRVSSINYTLGTKAVKKDLLDCNLSDFLNYFENQPSFKAVIVSMANLTRIYRNFVHPGNEMKNKEKLDNSKIQLCFHSAMEIAKYLLK